ncbi:MAG: PEP-CTERM sorting domain-containing protein [Pirellulales bacterium]|nr:PEP-CTERM sorting domain-containing protein [Pirellulales bacterium]
MTKHYLRHLALAGMLALTLGALAGGQAWASAYSDAVTMSGPIAWYRMSDANDATGNHDGTAGAGVSFTATSPIAGDSTPAALFTSTTPGGIIVPDDPAFNFGALQDLSIEFWAKCDADLGKKALLNKGDTHGSFWLRYENSDATHANGSVKFLLDYDKQAQNVWTTETYQDGQWHHFVATVGRTDAMRLYIDGQLAGETPILPNNGDVSSTLDLQIGSLGTSQPYRGYMDEVAIYNSALSSTSIINHYDLGVGNTTGSYYSAVSGDSPIGWWRLDNQQDETFNLTSFADYGVAFGQPGAIAGDYSGSAYFDEEYWPGQAEILVTDDPSINFGEDTDFSVEAWVKRSEVSSKEGLINKGDSDSSYWLRFEADGKLNFLLDFGDTALNAASTLEYDDDAWHHVVGVANRDVGVQLWVDGTLVGETSVYDGYDISSPGFDLEIGQMTAGQYLDGSMDEVAFYDRVLGDAEVLAHYQAAQAGNVPGDATNDGFVNEYDARVLASKWLQEVSGGAWDGDFNGDGWVDDLDASILAANWTGSAEGAAVPEPGTLAGLFILLAVWGVVFGRRLYREE